VYLEILIVVILILVNGLLAMGEMAVVSSQKARLKDRAEKHSGARAALELAEQPARFLSTIQIGITLIGILSGAFGGATIAERIDEVLQPTSIAEYGEAIGVAVVVTAITLVTIVLGELVPKRLALANPEAVASALAPLLKALSVMGKPAVWALSTTSDLVIRGLGLHSIKREAVTEEEIQSLVEEGARSGTIARTERDMVHRVFRLGDKLVRDIMTPRTAMDWLDLDAPAEENLETIRRAVHARFPVMRGAAQDPVGIVQIKDLVLRQTAPNDAALFAHLRKPIFVPGTVPALKLLELFKQSDMHFALVVDEFGSVSGLVTLTDILEAIVGDVPTAEERREPPVVIREDGSYLIDGMFPADSLMELLGLRRLASEDAHAFTTLAGMVIAHLARVPATGDRFRWSGWEFEVVDMVGPRVDKVLVIRAPAGAPPQPTSTSG
jgi:putative hemolysin